MWLAHRESPFNVHIGNHYRFYIFFVSKFSLSFYCFFVDLFVDWGS